MKQLLYWFIYPKPSVDSMVIMFIIWLKRLHSLMVGTQWFIQGFIGNIHWSFGDQKASFSFEMHEIDPKEPSLANQKSKYQKITWRTERMTWSQFLSDQSVIFWMFVVNGYCDDQNDVRYSRSCSNDVWTCDSMVFVNNMYRQTLTQKSQDCNLITGW